MLNDKRVHCVAYYAKLISSIWCAPYKHARTAQHNTHTKDEESKTKTNQPANKPFIQKFSWNEAPFLEKTICSNMYHDFSSKQSVNSTSFYLHFCMRLFEKKKTTWKCVSVFSSRTRIPMKWCECMFLVEMSSNVERYGWPTTFLPFNFKRAFENASQHFFGVYIFYAFNEKFPSGENNKCYI